ncbi:MAG: hypothetical protein J6B60_05795 [Clostridia bacterium]|nr:hypothetical protein [Clostridia bacterium]
MIKNKKLATLCGIFVLIEAILAYFIFVSDADFTAVASFLSIVCAFLFSLLFLDVKSKSALIQLGLLFTMCADSFLVLAEPIRQSEGMVFFSLTQTCYFLYLYLSDSNEKRKKVHICVRACAILIAEAVMVSVIRDKTDFLSVISLFYIANLATSVVFSYTQGRKMRIFAIALTLFIMCDILIGLSSAIGVYFDVSESSLIYKIAHPGFNVAWVFYLPSQILIAIYTALINERFTKS